MARPKTRIQYTLKDYPGCIIEVESKKDDEKSRALAIEEILRRIDEETDDVFDADSFPNGLSIEDLIFVDSNQSPDKKTFTGDRELQPVEIAAKEIAQFSLLRVQLQKNQELARQYLDLITALFSPTPLTEEQMEILQRKKFAKTLENLASSKVSHDEFLEKAELAWKILHPVIQGNEIISNTSNSKKSTLGSRS